MNWAIFDSGSIPAWAGETSLPLIMASAPQVYPRVGGGNTRPRTETEPGVGLSPRGRGKQRRRAAPGPAGRSIPAWAGETGQPLPLQLPTQVYPRVGGGNSLFPLGEFSHSGLSPRGRGKRRHHMATWKAIRSIPAWAGETASGSTWLNPIPVYPRVGGGNCSGLSPLSCARGLSPRGRGKHKLAVYERTGWRVYPRVGGGNPCPRPGTGGRGGLSPRGRGKHGLGSGVAPVIRSIPAWAGETLALASFLSL